MTYSLHDVGMPCAVSGHACDQVERQMNSQGLCMLNQPNLFGSLLLTASDCRILVPVT